jgi:hypothetical protein
MGEKRNMCRLLEGIVGIAWHNFHWIVLAQDRDKQRALVNALMNLQIQ